MVWFARMAQMNHEFEKNLYADINSRMKEWDPKYGNPHKELCTLKDLKAFVQVGAEMGIEVKILAKARQHYITSSTANDVDDHAYGESIVLHDNIVPKGSAYIEIANEMRRMGEFYTKVDALSEQVKVSPKSSHK